MVDKIMVTHQQMNLMLAAAEHAYWRCHEGDSLKEALSNLFDLYEITPEKQSA